MQSKDALNSWYQGKGHWDSEPDENWMNWRWQLQNRISKIEDFSKYLCLTKEEKEGFEFADQKLADPNSSTLSMHVLEVGS